MGIISDNILYGSSVSNGKYMPTSYKPRIIFRDQISGHSFAVDEPSVFKNILLLGSAGSGKTNVLNQIVAQVKYWNTSEKTDGVSLIFDTKGDYIGHKDFLSPGDYIIGNDHRFRNQSVTWNIFDEVLVDGNHPIDYESNAREIASILFKGRGSQTQPFFCNAARDILANVIIYFIRKNSESPNEWSSQLNNYDLVDFILRHTPEMFVDVFKDYPDMTGLITYIGNGINNQALGVFGELRSMINDCFQGVFAKRPTTTQPSFSIRKAIRSKGGKSVFVLYDLSIGETLTPIYRLLIDLAFKESLSDFSNGHTHIFLDELKLLPKITHLEDALNFGRSKHVSVVAGLQSIGQIYSIYGKETGQVILSGFGSIFALRTIDYESREYVSRLFGTNFTSYRYHNESKTPIDKERDGYTVEQWHYRSLEKPGQAIVGLSSQNDPFFFYFEEDMF